MTVPTRRLPEDAATALTAVDLLVGVVSVASGAAGATARRLRVAPVLAFGARPFLRAGRSWRERFVRDLDTVLPQLVDLAVRRYVDLDDLVATVDLDAVAGRLDVDAVARRLDVEAVIGRVDLDAVAARLDIEAVLDRVDLTGAVLGRVDLKVVVDAVLAQLDLPALVEVVLDEIDLPEIIRDSTGTMASETVRSVRMQGVSADEAVTRAVGRLLNRRRPTPEGAS